MVAVLLTLDSARYSHISLLLVSWCSVDLYHDLEREISGCVLYYGHAPGYGINYPLPVQNACVYLWKEESPGL